MCKLKLKLGFVQATSVQAFQILAVIISSALGGKAKPKNQPKTYNDAVAAFQSVFGV